MRQRAQETHDNKVGVAVFVVQSFVLLVSTVRTHMNQPSVSVRTHHVSSAR